MLHVLVVIALAQPKLAPARFDGVPIGKGTTLATVTLTKPTGGWSVGRMLKVEGRISDTSIDPVTVSINGDRYLMRTRGGTFSREFPAASGKNVVTVLATNARATPRTRSTGTNPDAATPPSAAAQRTRAAWERRIPARVSSGQPSGQLTCRHRTAGTGLPENEHGDRIFLAGGQRFAGVARSGKIRHFRATFAECESFSAWGSHSSLRVAPLPATRRRTRPTRQAGRRR